MVIRSAIAFIDTSKAQIIKNELVAASIRSFSNKSTEISDQIEFEIDVAVYINNFELLKNSLLDIDLLFLSFDFLQKYRSMLLDLYHSNPKCLTVAVGSPNERICDFLAIRPAGHVQIENDNLQIEKLCGFCAMELRENDEVLQIATRGGRYAVSCSSIQYCQSNQKYILIVTDKGKVYRKLGKLSDLQLCLPLYFKRVHQSFIVNWYKVLGLDKTNWEILLDTDIHIPVSRIYQRSVEELFKKCQFNC